MFYSCLISLHFTHAPEYYTCSLFLLLLLFVFFFQRLQSCRSHIEILEGLHEIRERGERSERVDHTLMRVCGPAIREARDPAGRFLARQAVTSKGANLTILIRRAGNQSPDEEEFVDGAFAFHDGKFINRFFD